MRNIFEKLIGKKKREKLIINDDQIKVNNLNEDKEQPLDHPRNLKREEGENKKTPESLSVNKKIEEPSEEDFNKINERYKEGVRKAFGGEHKKF